MTDLSDDALAYLNFDNVKIYIDPDSVTLHIATRKGCGVKSRNIKFRTEDEAKEYLQKIRDYISEKRSENCREQVKLFVSEQHGTYDEMAKVLDLPVMWSKGLREVVANAFHDYQDYVSFVEITIGNDWREKSAWKDLAEKTRAGLMPDRVKTKILWTIERLYEKKFR